MVRWANQKGTSSILDSVDAVGLDPRARIKQCKHLHHRSCPGEQHAETI